MVACAVKLTPAPFALHRNLLNEHAEEAQALVFVIDSARFNKDVRQVSELFYTVLTHPALVNVPVLVACSKQVRDADGIATI